ncbi:GMC oxidoreductase [Anditalea andensis]|uniref:2-keto-gluconate dehydrogenase n=1 Tax=Anditalea andensis TaxID=1048983 RepID=A0A074KW25_9BACT|nr:GMC oxidoreductase [Anditalea andensis]KEO73109.1 2-keto-gluconate dehydrogenase [Anditalea andensis]
MNDNRFDLIMVGSSFASSFFLKQYLEKAPTHAKILVLERGYLYPHTERLKAQRGEENFIANPNQSNNATFLNATDNKQWEFQTGFGGSSNCWHGCTPRFMPSDFKMQSLYGVAADWPIQYDELDPYYTAVEGIMSISGASNPPYPKHSAYPLPPHIFSTVDNILHNHYGNLYVHPPTARASIPINGRGACCASAVCSICPVNAKFTIENGLRDIYSDPRVELVYGAQVHALGAAHDSINSIHYIHDGIEKTAMAEVYALGANAIFNAHILLNSGDDNPLTGKGIGEQISLEARVDLHDLDCVGGSTKVNANGYMLYDGNHRKEFAACLMEANNTPYIRFERGKWRHQARFRMIFENLPENENHVSLTSDKLKPAVHFNGVSEYALKGIENMKKVLPDVLSCLPVEKIEYSALHPTESHILGSTRMSLTPETGVVDKNLLHHQYRNLFVLGSGAFTTYSPSNPTLTLSALSMMAADRSF